MSEIRPHIAKGRGKGNAGRGNAGRGNAGRGLAAAAANAHLWRAEAGKLMTETWREKGERTYRSWMRWIRTNVRPGLRSLLGILLIFGGLLGFLPVLGFWMIPLGVAVILLDVRVFRRWRRRRLNGRRPD